MIEQAEDVSSFEIELPARADDTFPRIEPKLDALGDGNDGEYVSVFPEFARFDHRSHPRKECIRFFDAGSTESRRGRSGAGRNCGSAFERLTARHLRGGDRRDDDFISDGNMHVTSNSIGEDASSCGRCSSETHKLDLAYASDASVACSFEQRPHALAEDYSEVVNMLKFSALPVTEFYRYKRTGRTYKYEN